ncbi:MAG: class I SAM-dependent methyltransferase [Nitrospirae bacterium]|nr:class I SAM-dependent methyltransferase [Nitrospirota bacterium]
MRTELRRRLRRILRRDRPAHDPFRCEILTSPPPAELTKGWQSPDVPARQRDAFQPVLQEMYAGRPREDFLALSQAVTDTGLASSRLVEAGCGNGWNAEVLRFLLKQPIDYVGLDYSTPMIHLARSSQPDHPFLVGDATALPLKTNGCDVLISGTVLMHLLGYAEAIQEAGRVSRRWCIFHTVPVVRRRATTLLRKLAYNSPVVEIIFNENELCAHFEKDPLHLERTYESVPHSYLDSHLGEPVQARTYLCRVA